MKQRAEGLSHMTLNEDAHRKTHLWNQLVLSANEQHIENNLKQ